MNTSLKLPSGKHRHFIFKNLQEKIVLKNVVLKPSKWNRSDDFDSKILRKIIILKDLVLKFFWKIFFWRFGPSFRSNEDSEKFGISVLYCLWDPEKAYSYCSLMSLSVKIHWCSLKEQMFFVLFFILSFFLKVLPAL